MLIDYHIHSTFSNDSEASLDGICQQAIAMGVKQIAITDHVDYKYPIQPPDFAISDMDLYFEVLSRYQAQYKDQLTIRIGMEIGLEMHHLQTYDTLIKQYPFDFIIASLHMIDGLEPHLGEYYLGKTKEEAYRTYYEHIDAFLDQYDNFDVLGHLDYVKRYMPYPIESDDHLLCMDTMQSILQKLIAKNKGLEINTSGFRHASKAGMPHFDIIAQYHALGGRRLTVGSDSHVSESVGFMIPQTIKQLRMMGFETLSTFEQRREIRIPLTSS